MYNLIFVEINLTLVLHKYTYINYIQIYNIHVQTYKCNRHHSIQAIDIRIYDVKYRLNNMSRSPKKILR